MNGLYVCAAILALVVFIAAAQSTLQINRPFVRKLSPDTAAGFTYISALSVFLVIVGYLRSSGLLLTSIEFGGLKAQMAQTQNQLQSLRAQVEALYADRKIEIYDTSRWKELSFTRQRYGDEDGYRVSLELAASPIPSSVEVFRGSLVVTPNEIKISGRRIEWNTYSDRLGSRGFPDPIVVIYHPKP